MNSLNTVLKLNIKGKGDSLIWLYSTPTIQESEVDLYFPMIPATLLGPNLGFSSKRINQETLYLTTLSKWNLKDEFGRKGLSLSQGVIVNLGRQDSRSILETCASFSGLLNLHKTRYQTIGELLECLATEGDEGRARKLTSEMFTPFLEPDQIFNKSLVQLSNCSPIN